MASWGFGFSGPPAGFDALIAQKYAIMQQEANARSSEANANANLTTVRAGLLPGAFYCRREPRLPPMAALREAGVPMAVSTDSNPGTSPLTSLLLAMNMACTLFRLTPLEALTGATRHAAAALGLSGTCGVLAPGCVADFALWRIDRPADLAYAMGLNPCAGVVKDGVVVA